MFSSFQHKIEGNLIQVSETKFKKYSTLSGSYADIIYRQLWLFTMRHYPRLPKKLEKPNPVAKPTHEKADEAILYDI